MAFGLSLSLFPNRVFPPVLPPKRLVGGGPAGVVDGLKLKPDGPGVVEPAGAAEVGPPVEAFPKSPLESPSSWGFGGVCVPPRPPKDGVPEIVPRLPTLPLGLLSDVAPFDVLFSPALDVPKPAKLKPLPAEFVPFPPPKRLPPDG